MRSFLNDETGLIERCVLLCDGGAAESRSDYAVVVGAIEYVVVFLHVGGSAEKMIGGRRTEGRGGRVAREHVQPDRGYDDNECDEGTYWGEETARAIVWAVMEHCLASALYGGRHCSLGVGAVVSGAHLAAIDFNVFSKTHVDRIVSESLFSSSHKFNLSPIRDENITGRYLHLYE